MFPYLHTKETRLTICIAVTDLNIIGSDLDSSVGYEVNEQYYLFLISEESVKVSNTEDKDNDYE